MATDLKPGPDASVTSLVSGIIDDAQRLVTQQFAMLKEEVRADFQRVRKASIGIGVGVGLALLGGFLLTQMLAHLLHWAAPDLPLWAYEGIFGGLFCIAGLFIFYRGNADLTSFNPLPDQTVQALKENVQWKTVPK